MLGAITLDMVAVLLGGATALLPIYAKEILHTGPWGLGFLRSATAVGALAMALFLARHPLQRHAGRTMFIAVARLRRRDDRVRPVALVSAVVRCVWSCWAPRT